MKKDVLIEHCLHEAQDKGIRIIRGGALFNWCNAEGGWSEIPTGCDGIGAVLIHFDKAEREFKKGWLKEAYELIGCDYFWFVRFNQGFDYNCSPTIIKRVNGKDVHITDSVSKKGMQLAKKFIPELTGRSA